MKRREFVASVLAGGVSATAVSAQDHNHRPLEGPLANATVGFGGWESDVPFDRFLAAGSPLGPNDRTRNVHQLIPHEVKIKVGGTVNFIIGGFHNVQVYAPGTTPEDIKALNPIPTISVAVLPGPPIIDVTANRIYRGLDPSVL